MNGPKLWADMLAAINIPGAVVAGGCIRDCFLSLEPKDIDIFIPVTSRDDMISKLYDAPVEVEGDFFSTISSGCHGNPRYGTLEMLEPGEHANEPGKRYDEYDDAFGANGDLHGVAEGEYFGYQVNIIGRKAHEGGVQELIESFDFGFLQMYYTEQTGVIDTIASRVDRYLKKYTMQHDRHVEQSIGRWLRFNNRHPGLLALDLPFEYTLPCSIL